MGVRKESAEGERGEVVGKGKDVLLVMLPSRQDKTSIVPSLSSKQTLRTFPW